MTGRRPDSPIMAWSVAIYALILQVYPHTFREQFGESMIQVFADAVRDAWTAAGPIGVLRVWVKTAVDVVCSAWTAYAAEARDPFFRRAAALGVLYAAALAGVVLVSAVRFGEFYPAPAFSRFGAPDAGEAVLLAAYERALEGDFGHYRRFVQRAGVLLAVLLGAVAALFGLSQRSLLHGAGALAAGVVATTTAFALMPVIWFPLDRYPVGALWVMGGGVLIAAATWIATTWIGRRSPAGRATR